jgi:glycine dehydrogenase subunit 1
MRYIANTAQDQRAMLETIGAPSIEALLARVPARARLGRALDLPAAAAEMDLITEMQALAATNADADRYTCFLGGG